MKDMNEMKGLLESVIDRFASKPVVVRMIEALHAITYNVQAQPEDVGRLIGPRGQMAESLEMIFNRLGSKGGKQIFIDIIKSPMRVKDRHQFSFNPDYNIDYDLSLLRRIVTELFGDGVEINLTVDNETGQGTYLNVYAPKEDRYIMVALNTIFDAIGERQGRHLTVLFK